MIQHLQNLSRFEFCALWGVLAVALLGLLYAVFLRLQIIKLNKGTPQMQAIWRAIKQGSDVYLSRQLRTILPSIVILSVILFLSVYVIPPMPEALIRFAGYPEAKIKLFVGLGRSLAFILGAGFSLLVGQFGMRTAVEGNIRVASAARHSFPEALKIAYRSGTITGMLTDGLGLLGGIIIFLYFGLAAPDALLGFGLAEHC